MKQQARIATVAVAGTALLACGTGSVGDWPMYRGDAEGTGYSALSEITTANVADLAQAWSYSLASVPTSVAGGPLQIRPARSQATPIVVGGLMYLPVADGVVALDTRDGRERWQFLLGGGGAPPSRRGVAY